MALTVVPNSGQTLNSSRTQISGNFATIDTAFQIDHVDYNLANQGMHETVTFPIGSAPTVSSTGFIGLYGALDLAGNPQIFVNNTSTGNVGKSTKQVPMTAGFLQTTGWSYLPSGLLMKWGQAPVGHTTGIPYTFPVAGSIPVFTTALVSIPVNWNLHG
jgi:hypothetical protein